MTCHLAKVKNNNEKESIWWTSLGAISTGHLVGKKRERKDCYDAPQIIHNDSYLNSVPGEKLQDVSAKVMPEK